MTPRDIALLKITLGSVVLFATACSARSSSPAVASVTEAASVDGTYAYTVDPGGLVTSVGASDASYGIARSGSILTAGASTYRLDPLGQVTAMDDLSLTYGPDGQIARASRGAETVSYLYDENGQRILKSTGEAQTEAYVDGVYVTATELDEPVKAAGRLVGLLRNGAFTLTANDIRGSIQADTNGTQRLASPFGTRPVHPDVASAVDYAAKGFDTTLDADRMGVRDYDARIASFLQPDPLFLLHPERCIDSPVECNLYGYAKGSPASLVDPTGENAKDFLFNALPHLFTTSITSPFVSLSLSVGTKGDQAGTFYFSGSIAPLTTTAGWTKADWKHPFGASVVLSTLLPRAGEASGPSAERVNSFATGPSMQGQACWLGACAGATHNGSGTSVDYGIGVGFGTKGSSGIAGSGSMSVRLGNPTDWISTKAYGLFNPDWRLDTPSEKAHAAAYGPSAPSRSSAQRSP